MRKLTIKEENIDLYYGSRFVSDLALLVEKYTLFGKTVMLITGVKSFRNSNYYLELKEMLVKTNCQLIKEKQVNSNPKLKEIRKFDKFNKTPDIIFAVGGGSVIDFAKALKLFYYKKAEIFVIYTLLGTSSIITPFTILDNDEFKIGKHSEKIIPNYVYVNIEIIRKTPIKLVNMGIFDICAHIIESYLSKVSTKKSRIYALIAVAFLNKYIKSGSKDITSLLRADVYAGLSERIGLVLFPHAAGHYLTYKFKIPHSVSTMYFLKKYVALLNLNGFLIDRKLQILLNYLDKSFIKNYKRKIFIAVKEEELSYKMIEKYMPFVFENSPINFNKTDYHKLYEEYEKN